MSQSAESSNQPENLGLKFNKMVEDFQSKISPAIEEVQEKAQDSRVRHIATQTVSIGIALGLTYYASKRGARAALKEGFKSMETTLQNVNDYAEAIALFSEAVDINTGTVLKATDRVNSSIKALNKVKK